MVARFVGPRWASVVLVLGGLALGGSARAQSPTDDPRVAVRLAKAAFEYRDFERVVRILDPWLHPPRIVDRGLEVQARELLGVSQHVLGNVPAAEEEFAQLLVLAPKHELDPFLVPPPVVQTFEEVRAKMKSRLDELGDEPPAPKPDPKVVVQTRVELVEVPHPGVLVAPFGIPQFVLDEPGWGALWASVQAIGIVANVLGWVQSQRADTRAAWLPWQVTQWGGIVTFVGGWAGSGFQGYTQLEARRRELLSPAPAVPPDEAAPGAHMGSAAGASWSWAF